jgi:hypothetical protein
MADARVSSSRSLSSIMVSSVSIRLSISASCSARSGSIGSVSSSSGGSSTALPACSQRDAFLEPRDAALHDLHPGGAFREGQQKVGQFGLEVLQELLVGRQTGLRRHAGLEDLDRALAGVARLAPLAFGRGDAFLQQGLALQAETPDHGQRIGVFALETR